MRKKRRSLLYKTIIFLIVVDAVLFAFLLLKHQWRDKKGFPFRLPETRRTTVLEKTKPVGDAYLRDTVFIGDSRTNGMMAYGFIDASQTFAVDGMSHEGARTERFIRLDGKGKKLTIAQAMEKIKPVRAIISFGINGVGFMDEEVFFQEYDQFLDELIASSPDTIYILQSILPITKHREKVEADMTNEKIDRYNVRLQKLAEEKGMYFLNTAEALKNDQNALDRKYDSGDGLHFNKKAYEVIFDYILTHPAEK